MELTAPTLEPVSGENFPEVADSLAAFSASARTYTRDLAVILEMRAFGQNPVKRPPSTFPQNAGKGMLLSCSPYFGRREKVYRMLSRCRFSHFLGSEPSLAQNSGIAIETTFLKKEVSGTSPKP